jgi:parvulin-like peptidyl-prolyl isomerase
LTLFSARLTTALTLCLLTGLLASLSACQSETKPAPTASLQVGDFVKPGPATPPPQPTVAAAQPAATPDAQPPTSPGTLSNITPPPPTADGRRREYVVDAMVGQVNGKPIYASEIFRVIGEDVLERLGREKPRLEFQRDAAELVINELRSRITNAVILAEAERGLTEQEQMGLALFVKQQREEILSKYGGVLSQAEAGLMRDNGRTLDEELESRRQRLLTDKYLRDKLHPRVSVNRREVERYYYDHPDEFNPAPTVTVRVILVPTAAAADEVEKALTAGASFESVARQYSSFRADAGGLLSPFRLSGPLSSFSAMSFPQLNEAVRQLSEGQRSPRVKLDQGFGWVMLEKVEGGKAKTLEEAFLEIESRIRSQKFNMLSRRYLDQLMKSGNYTPIDQMAGALIEVAMARYARPQ